MANVGTLRFAHPTNSLLKLCGITVGWAKRSVPTQLLPYTAEILTRHTESCIVKTMKITLDINDSLLANAKALAARQQTNLTQLIEEGLQLRLRSSQVAPKPGKRKIPVFKGRGGMVPGLNPCSNKAMLDAADNNG